MVVPDFVEQIEHIHWLYLPYYRFVRFAQPVREVQLVKQWVANVQRWVDRRVLLPVSTNQCSSETQWVIGWYPPVSALSIVIIRNSPVLAAARHDQPVQRTVTVPIVVNTYTD